MYVSQHEGFGIPPLECLASGTPVVVSSGLGLDEGWPDYPFRCRDRSPDAIFEALRKALSQEWWNDAAVAESVRVLRGFGWEYSSRLLVAVLEQAVAR